MLVADSDCIECRNSLQPISSISSAPKNYYFLALDLFQNLRNIITAKKKIAIKFLLLNHSYHLNPHIQYNFCNKNKKKVRMGKKLCFFCEQEMRIRIVHSLFSVCTSLPFRKFLQNSHLLFRAFLLDLRRLSL